MFYPIIIEGSADSERMELRRLRFLLSADPRSWGALVWKWAGYKKEGFKLD